MGKKFKNKYAIQHNCRGRGRECGACGGKGSAENNKKPRAANIKSKIDHKPDGGPRNEDKRQRRRKHQIDIRSLLLFWVLLFCIRCS